MTCAPEILATLFYNTNVKNFWEPSDGYIHDVEWFWQAEEGKTLIWDMEKANEQAREFGLRDISEED